MKKLDDDFYIDDADEEIQDEVEAAEYDLPDCSRCGAKPGFGQNVDNQGYTSCDIDEAQGLVVQCNKCKDRMC